MWTKKCSKNFSKTEIYANVFPVAEQPRTLGSAREMERRNAHERLDHNL
jgi:hypothetical protein